eukprot:CCRYP_000853-RA/>CCRYP_000853-RA protein AED:0.34 eAED:0.38 QI:0/0/0/1/0/0/5/0/390
MLNAVLNDETGKELGRLVQGLPSIVKGTDTIVFIHKTNVPQDHWRDIIYECIANFCPKKEDPHQIRLTVGGNRINFPGDCGTPTADMITVKILLNRVISTKNSKFMTIDIKDFYLNTPMERPVFMQIKLSDIPNNIIDLYKLRDIAHDVYVFVRIQKGMYGLPQAGIIAQQLLKQRLHANRYHQSKINPVCPAPMATNNSCAPVPTNHRHWASNKRLSYKKSSEFFFTMPGQFTELCSRHLVHSQHSRTTLQQPHLTESTNSWTMPCHTPMLVSLTAQVMCFSGPQNELTQPCQWALLSFQNDHYPNNNGAVLAIAQIIKAVMSSAAEAELGVIYINAREVIPLRHLLIEMGHPQQPTPIQTDNSTALEHHPTKTHQGHGHALSLAELPH